jgi:hypothetical protein
MEEDPLRQTGAGGSDSGDLAELRRAWVNEKAAPEILQCVGALFERSQANPHRTGRYKLDVVDRLMHLVQHQVPPAATSSCEE